MVNKNKMATYSISVFILTRNSAATLKDTLESVKNFDDIIICDGGSTDETLNIAGEYGARIIPQPVHCLDSAGRISDFSCVRNACVAETKYDWVLYVDSDEEISEELGKELLEIATNPIPEIFIWWIPRKYYLGKELIECSIGYPNSQLRFFNKKHIKGFVKPIHERIDWDPKEKAATTRHFMYIDLPSLEIIKKKTRHYLELEEQKLAKADGPELRRGIIHTLRAMAGIVLRLRNVIFCRGKRSPFGYEWTRVYYNYKLLTILFRKLLASK